ncbi:hypothetical protein CWRG_00167 [Chthonomonas calidirosea]|uniref:hypothetical protein n=1 Tax=Chthonomonas calidirosea TaxID=454171 RepID=UPI0006DD4667|nr:hypothetical protein [Chthonomonas calidirosea]CEK12718.1 hypothetical protein CWRG_00167 [Chthonomonas calidirosea]
MDQSDLLSIHRIENTESIREVGREPRQRPSPEQHQEKPPKKQEEDTTAEEDVVELSADALAVTTMATDETIVSEEAPVHSKTPHIDIIT